MGRLRTADTTTSGIFDPDDATTSAIDSRLRNARDRSLDLAGVPGLVSDIDEFYEVDINAIDPQVITSDWRLAVTGAVETELILSADDIRTLPAVHRFGTLRCVGEPLNGHKMDTALWTGVPVNAVLDRVTPTGAHVVLRAADDYFEGFPLAALRDGLLAYGMNGRSLPRKHGSPLRALVPGHWGEVNVKWLTEIEVTETPNEGYWERRGWHGTGPVNTVAKLHAENLLETGLAQVGGHAYAGTRGIDRVEVSLDGGTTWNDAVLSEPLEASDVWRQWKFEWEPTKSTYDVVVRAIDGEGNRQPRVESQPFPSGPTGWVARRVRF